MLPDKFSNIFFNVYCKISDFTSKENNFVERINLLRLKYVIFRCWRKKKRNEILKATSNSSDTKITSLKMRRCTAFMSIERSNNS